MPMPCINFAKILFCSVFVGFWLPANVNSNNCNYPLKVCYVAASPDTDCSSSSRNLLDCKRMETYVKQCPISCSTMVFLNGLHHIVSNEFCPCYTTYNQWHYNNIITFTGSGTAGEVRISGVHFTFYNINVRMMNITFEDSTFVRSIEKTLSNHIDINKGRMTITNCIFISSSMTLIDINLLIRHSNFSNSLSKAITLYSSTITLEGNVSFTNNTGRKGGALALIGTTMYIKILFTFVIFQNNRALEKGGAIFVDNIDIHLYTHSIASYCFYVFTTYFERYNKYGIKVYFSGNSANLGGNHIYGGILKSTCIATDCFCVNSNVTLNSLFSFKPSLNSSPSALSGNPTRVCACDSNGQPHCAKSEYIFQTGLEVYPGEKFNISVVIVGGDFGTTIGTVYAKFAFTNTSALDSVSIDTNTCTNLTYSILSSNIREVMYLSADDRNIEEDFSYAQYRSNILADIANYDEYDIISPLLLTGYTFVNITTLSCPPGFSLSSFNSCDCYPSLKEMGFECVLSDRKGYLSWNSLVWIGRTTIQDNVTDESGVIVSKLCPLHYCRAGHKFVDLQNGSDAQCEFNHSGILCGGCRPGLSVVIGSTNCIHCPNSNNLALLLFFAPAGFFLIFAISVLNLTVTQGKINGFIFYANVIWSYQVSLFPHRATDLSTFLRAFIAWLNLDFGIETCFVEGLDAYWKAWLQFVFPFYTASLFLVGLRYSSKISKVFGDRSVPTLATLLFLSYTKLLRTVIAALSFVTLTAYPNQTKMLVWLVDGNLLYGCSPHLFLLMMAVACLILLWIPYTVLLFSMQWLRKIDHHRPLRMIGKFKPLYDAYFAPLRDGHHYWFGMLLLAQCTVLIMSSVTFNAPSVGLIGLIVISTFLFCYLNCMHVYKDKSTMIIDSSLHVNIILLVSGLQFFSRSVITTACFNFHSIC